MSTNDDSVASGSPELYRMASKEEERFLSLLLRYKELLMDAVGSDTMTDHFWNKKSQRLFEIIDGHYREYGALLTRCAMEGVIAAKNYSDVDAAAIMNAWGETWSNTEAVEDDYKHLKRSISNRYLQREALGICKSKFDELQNAKVDQDKIVNSLQVDLMGIEGLSEDPYAKSMDVDEGYDRAIKYIEDVREHPDQHRGVYCGIRGIDDVFNGFGYGTYTVISGMINGGKTTLMINMANNMAKAGKSVVYVSLEKTADLYFRRVICLNALCDYNRVKKGGKLEFGVTDYWLERLKDAAEEGRALKQNFQCLQFLPQTKLTKILLKVNQIKSIKKIDVLFVDYLSVIGFETHHKTRPDLDLAAVHQRLFAYGKENNLVVVTAAQLKNQSTKEIRRQAKGGKSSGVEDMSSVSVNTEDYGGSQIIMADADNAMAVVLSEEFPATEMMVYVTKARDDRRGQNIPLLFDGAIGRVYDRDIAGSELVASERMLYNKDVTEEALTSDDNLFDGLASGPKEDSEEAAIGLELDLDEDLKKLDVGSLAPPEVQPKVQPKEPPLSEEVKEVKEEEIETFDEWMKSKSKSRSRKKPDTDNILDTTWD